MTNKDTKHEVKLLSLLMTGTRYCKLGISDTKHTSNIQLVTAITVSSLKVDF